MGHKYSRDDLELITIFDTLMVGGKRIWTLDVSIGEVPVKLKDSWKN